MIFYERYMQRIEQTADFPTESAIAEQNQLPLGLLQTPAENLPCPSGQTEVTGHSPAREHERKTSLATKRGRQMLVLASRIDPLSPNVHEVAAKILDIVQAEYDPRKGSFVRYTKRVARGLSRNTKRSWNRFVIRARPLTSVSNQLDEDADDEHDRLIRRLDLEPIQAAVKEAMAGLAELDRLILKLRFWSELTRDQTLAELRKQGFRLNLPGLKSRTIRVYQALRSVLAAFHPRGRRAQEGNPMADRGRSGPGRAPCLAGRLG